MILVTGGAGFVDSNFVLDWVASSHEPLVNLHALSQVGNLENLGALVAHAGHICARGDICDRSLLDRLLSEHRPRAMVRRSGSNGQTSGATVEPSQGAPRTRQDFTACRSSDTRPSPSTRGMRGRMLEGTRGSWSKAR